MANKEPGYVYILTNPSFKEDWVKIGKSSRPVDVRSKELDNTAVPLPFEIFATMKTAKYNEAEKLVHRYIERFTNLRIRNNREFFNVKPEEALDIFREVGSLLDDVEIEEVYKNGVKGVSNRKVCSESTTSIRPNLGNRIWLIPYNKKFFDLAGCYKKFGEVYWTQHFHFQAGDTGYIYGAAPESAIRFSFRVKKTDLPYDPIMDQEDEFVKDNGTDNSDTDDRLFAHLILTGETNNKRLSLSNLLDRGLKGAPMGAVNISKKELKDLLEYIEENF